MQRVLEKDKIQVFIIDYNGLIGFLTELTSNIKAKYYKKFISTCSAIIADIAKMYIKEKGRVEEEFFNSYQ